LYQSVAHAPSARSFFVWIALLCVVAAFLPAALPAAPAAAAESLFDLPTYLQNTQRGSRDVVAGDLNGDGALDLIVGYADFPPQVFINKGRGIFADPIDVPGLVATGSLALGDLNGDGKLDLVHGASSNEEGAAMTGPSNVAFGNGDGTFAGPFALPNSVGLTADVAIADLNGDGALDVLLVGGNYANSTTNSRIYLGRGDGSFIAAPPLPVGAHVDAVEAIALGDLNGDGALDLVATSAADVANGVVTYGQVFLGRGDGSFTLLATQPGGSYEALLGDLYGDARLVWVQVARLVLGLGDGTFGATIALPGPPLSSVQALGDLNGDGALDLAASSGVYLGRGDGTFDAPIGLPEDVAPGQLALADLNGDGMLDLVIAAPVVQVFRGRPRVDFRTLIDLWSCGRVAAGDLNGDGALDLQFDDARLFGDGDGAFKPALGPPGSCAGSGAVWALGDVDRDGRLDQVGLSALQPNSPPPQPPPPPSKSVPTKLVLGDLNGDGALDAVLGFGLTTFSFDPAAPTQVYLGNGDGSFAAPTSLPGDGGNVTDLALGDLNGDGALDIVATNARISFPIGPSYRFLGSRVYLGNGDGTFEPPTTLIGSERDHTGVALGDLNDDGALDIVLSSAVQPGQVYLGSGDGSFGAPADLPASDGYAPGVALGDLNGDGALDIALGSRLYVGNGDGSFGPPASLPVDPYNISNLALGDLNGDGVLDIVFGSLSGPSRVALSGKKHARGLADNPPTVSVRRPGHTADAGFFSTSEILGGRVIPIPYTLSDPESDPVGAVRAFYSLDGGGSWRPALAATGTITTNLATGPAGVAHTFSWDTGARGVFGQSDNVVVRIEAYGIGYGKPRYDSPAPRDWKNALLLPIAGNGQRARGLVASPYQQPYASATTFPFRVRGTQVRVVRGGAPAPGALVYRLRAGQALGGSPIGDTTSKPFTADARGYLRGRGEVRPGDRLLALAPISSTASYTLYATNGTPTLVGADAFTVTASGVQTLAVSLDHPLILFNVDVSLEWDASSNPSYLQQLQFNLQRASQYLYDFTDGQIALGRVAVHQNADDWAFSDVVIHATNRLRPFAAQGGVVLTPTLDPQHPDIVYDTGQVHIGATWNRYGTPGQTLGDDWSIALAHELSHYLLYQDDSYLGLNQNGFLVAVRSCTDSAMGDLYTSPDATEFVADQKHWDADCANTLANQTLHRTEWQTIDTWYPALHAPAQINPGPGTMPFDFTSVSIAPPITPTQALADPTFYLDYAGGQAGSNEAHAYLERDGKYIVDAGSPFGGQNRLLARGAQPGDRLCVFDRPRQQFGCQAVALGDDRLALRQDAGWAPVVRLTPVTSRTFELGVGGLPPGLALKARLFPEFGRGGAPIALVRSGSAYTGTLQADQPALSGNVQVWVDEPATGEQARRETIVAYAVGGNPGYSRGGGGYSRGGGGYSRGGGAPALSPDGQMIFFTPNPIIFQPGQFYTIQSAAGLPSLPDTKTVIGQAYTLVATAGTPVITGSISFQYLESDVLVAGVDENQLAVHFWDGQTWRALPTLRDPYVNLASAPSQGPGMYALMAGVSAPRVVSISPAASTNDTSTTLTIAGSGFLPPVRVSLVGAGRAYSLPVASAFSTTVTAVITARLEAREYQLEVTNGDGGRSAPVPFALYSPSPARFYDFFESGAGKWELDGEWGIVALPGGNRAMTDSPAGNYNSAIPPATTRTTHITSQPFSLDGLARPALTFRHDYVLARVGSSQDVARVEISTDNGATWATLASYMGGGIYGAGARAQDAQDPEWTNVDWKQVSIDLSRYSGTVRLRFSLEVDQTASDKGWVIDDVKVQ
jgi:hypothetical protein